MHRARSLSVKMIVQKNLPHWLLSAIEALPPEWQAVERPAPIKEQTAAEAAAARKERMQETQKKMQEGFKKATDGFVSGFLGFGNKLKSMVRRHFNAAAAHVCSTFGLLDSLIQCPCWTNSR